MARRFRTFIGVDLGGARGKTTAVARLSLTDSGVAVQEVMTRHRRARSETPWHDEAVLEYIAAVHAEPTSGGVVVAIDAPLTTPACQRCTIAACPGVEACVDVSTVWLRTIGAEMLDQAVMADLDRIAASPGPTTSWSRSGKPFAPARQRLSPYSHRCTEVQLHFSQDLIPREALSRSTGPIAARAAHLRRQLAARGYELNENLIEVSPRATVQALFGSAKARGYKRDADPWHTRAEIVESLDKTLRFALSSRLSREEVLRNDHCFDALLSAYTAYLWARDDWKKPDGEPFDADGWIWAPPAAT